MIEARPIGPGRVPCPLPLFAVLLADGGLLWSTDGERATTFLTKDRAIQVIGDGRQVGDVWGFGVARVRVIPFAQAIALGRVSRAQALGEG